MIRSIGGLPPRIVRQFEEPAAFQQAANGMYYVFDRRAHAVWTVDPGQTLARKAVTIGAEPGRILDPYGFDVAPDGSFVVADIPKGEDRIQIFDQAGTWKGGFFIHGNTGVRITIGNLVLNGIGAVRHTGRSLLVNNPESDALFTEYSLDGRSAQSIGRLRPTGHEQDRDLHVAMNRGLPLVDPMGGFYFVFITGQPMFRKYDAEGTLVFERHIEGREIDELIASQPSIWPRRVEDREVPVVTPVVRTAAVDTRGRLWVSLAVPYTYVYDNAGDKVRSVQFSAAGTISPVSLSFSPRGTLLVTPGCYEFAVD
ncbi:MAG TPA: hypothetical protein VL173_12090 [Vicinamibacterales bacterium]|nr:hypothetical protein [Vicinamibacterales bacterium]